MMGLFVILHGLKDYYERYVCVLLSWQSLSVNGNAFRDSANRNLQMLLGFGKFHGFATAVWNFTLLFHDTFIRLEFVESFNLQFVEKLQRRTWTSFEFF